MSGANILADMRFNKEKAQEVLRCRKPNFNIAKTYDNSMLYKIYKFIKVKDIDILVSNADRTTDIKERYNTSKPINIYMKENYKDFEKLASSVKNWEIERIEELQKEFQKNMPYFVRYDKNYIWQIYYSKEDDRYFMLFPTKEEGDRAVLFYMIKQKIQNPEEKIYVPICKTDYEEFYLKGEEIKDIENYIYMFTKEWPTIYEVTRENKKAYIIGKTKLREGFVSKYRIEIGSREDAEEVYTLLKALFILNTETDYNFTPAIGKNGSLIFKYEDEIIDSNTLQEFITKEAIKQKHKKEDVCKSISNIKEKLDEIKKTVSTLSEAYRTYEKQIVMFLECKKSVFKRVKFFFKKTKLNDTYVTIEGKEYIEDDEETIVEKKKNSMKKLNMLIKKKEGKSQDEIEEIEDNNQDDSNENLMKAEIFTLADLIRICKDNSSLDSDYKNVKADFNAMKIKKKNMKSKIDNAKDYLAEIEKHKKSIVDFWKFTSKDAVPNLTKGDENLEESKLQVSFNFDEDMIEVGQKADSIQKQKLSIDECNSIFACEYIMNSINAVLTGNNENKILENDLQKLKKRYTGSKKTEIFGEIEEDYTKVKNLGNNKHRENRKNIYSVLKVNDKTTLQEYKNTVEDIVKMLNEAYKKITSIAEFPVYYKNAEAGKYVVADIDPKNLIVDNSKNIDVTIYKTNITKDMHILYLSNIAYYDNYNKTLPTGMDEGTKVVIKLDQVNKSKESEINIVQSDGQYNINVKNIKVIDVNN